MRVISWNLGAAYGPFVHDHDRAWHWLAAADPDIALLQECVPPEWTRERWTILHLDFKHWTTAIVAKPSLALRALTVPGESILGRFGSYLATAELDVPAGSFLVASVHTRTAEVPDWVIAGHDPASLARSTVGVPWFNDAVFGAYRDLTAGRRFIIGGDWNTARYLDAVGEPKPDGQEFFDRAAASGWTELSLDEAGREGRSWFGSGNPRPYQPDHVFSDVQTAGSLERSTIDHGPASILRLSDHAPLLLDLRDPLE